VRTSNPTYKLIVLNYRIIKELERIWKEAVVVLFMVISRHLSEGSEEKYEIPQSGLAGLRVDI
jgi:hypothetical protein